MSRYRLGKNRLSRFLSSNFSHWKLVKGIYSLRQRMSANKPRDFSSLADEIFQLVGSIEARVFPFYGTLLFLVREGEITFADDYDFALIGKINIEDVNRKMSARGGKLVGITWDEGGNVYELSFDYKGCRVDFFRIFPEKGSHVHEFADFRNERAKLSFNAWGEERLYTRCYRLLFDEISLDFNADHGILMPRESENILKRIYGKDWETPKKLDFVDYADYEFFKRDVKTSSGDVSEIIETLTPGIESA